MAATKGFMSHLSLAACEWFLMFLMFINAALAYFLTKFAQYCELQTPCLFCLRLDHFFGNEDPKSYLSLFCSKHRAEVSSLISCSAHNKLADVREMCEDCFTSITVQNQSNSESYRFVVGSVGRDGYQRSYLNKNFVRMPLSTGACSCCCRQWKAKSTAQRLVQPSAVGLGASKVNVKPPLPRVSGSSRFCRRNSFKKVRDKISGSMNTRLFGNITSADTLSHVGYTELKITSDSESEFPFSDDDDANSAVMANGENSGSKDDCILQYDMGSHIKEKIPARHSHTASDPGPSLILDLHHDESITSRASSMTSNSSIGHDLGELNWAKFQSRPIPSASPELISLDDFPPSNISTQNNDVELPLGESAEKYKPTSSPPNTPKTPNISTQNNAVELPLGESDDFPPSNISTQNNDVELPLGEPAEKYKLTSSPPNTPSTQNNAVELPLGESEENLSAVSTPSLPHGTDTINGSKLSMTEGNESEPVNVKKDTDSFPSAISTQEMDSSTNSRNDLSSSDGIHVIQGLASLDKSESGCESVDGSSVSEIEGESLVEKLKRQVEYDRKCLSSLQSELEEERNAAAIAANQAMAMITRLQEEKASLHMEALQYLRMMEEQAEYDMEALEKANDLVTEKEKEIQDLEYELEFYKNHFDDEMMMGHVGVETENLNGENRQIGKFGANSSSDLRHVKVLETDSTSMNGFVASDKAVDLSTSISDLEDEKKYIFQCLLELERKLYQFSGGRTSNGMSNGNVHGGRTTSGVEKDERLQADRETQSHHLKGENVLSRHNDLSTSNGMPSTHDISGVNKKHVDYRKRNFSIEVGEVDLSAIESEISDLNERLEALEADRDFLEHACITLHNSGGLQFIQEIAHHLQDLRRIMFDNRSLSIT